MTVKDAIRHLDRNRNEKYNYEDFVLTFTDVWELVQGNQHVWKFKNTADLVSIMKRIAPLEEWF